jgi:hypothetical protein
MRTPRTPLVVRPTNRTSPGWQEFNSLPVTPPPVTDPGAPNLAAPAPDIAGPAGRAKAGLLFLIAGSIAVVAVAGLFIFFPRSTPSPANPQAETPSAEMHRAMPAAPSKPAEAVEVVRAPVVAIPAEVPPATKRHVEPEKIEALAGPARSKSHAPKMVPRPLGSDTPAEMPADSRIEPRVAPAPAAAATAASVEDFGMTLPRPMTRRPSRKIDETDPYAP